MRMRWSVLHEVVGGSEDKHAVFVVHPCGIILPAHTGQGLLGGSLSDLYRHMRQSVLHETEGGWESEHAGFVVYP